MSHTPGPWRHGRISHTSIRFHVFAKRGSYIADQIDHEANARLIAAAPDMLEALEAIVTSPTGDNRMKGRAALKKARGEA